MDSIKAQQIYFFSLMFLLSNLLLCPPAIAASGSVKVTSVEISENRQYVDVNVEFVVDSDDHPKPYSSYNTNGCYKECFSPTLDFMGSCNTFRYAYLKKSSPLLGSFSGLRSVERIWCIWV